MISNVRVQVDFVFSLDATPTVHMVLYFRESHRDRQRKTEETCSKSTSSDKTSQVNIQNCRSKTYMTGCYTKGSSVCILNKDSIGQRY